MIENEGRESARVSLEALLRNEFCSDNVVRPQFLATAPYVRKFGDAETVSRLAAFESRHPTLAQVLGSNVEVI
ncbi:hypothetical protein [Rhizobium leguminosarum]|uniref:hypothetical protein n=1 Tax=Rhizobium leguminosarum TaxID=384 RepID=UPI003F969BC4